MKTEVASKQDLITRKEAARRLGVSVRTIDRYIHKNMLTSKQKNRSVYLVEEEINDLVAKKTTENAKNNYYEAEPVDIEFEKKEDTISQDEAAVFADSSIVSFDNQRESGIYKDLYFDLKDELRDSQKRLETANYRVGQLENQLKNTVPLIELTKKEKEASEKETKWQEDLSASEQKNRALTNDLKKERSYKVIYLALLASLLLIEPILLLIEFLFQRPVI